jgi:uncharacterized protein (TIGR00369 family)
VYMENSFFSEDNYRRIIEEVIPFHHILGIKLLEIREGYCKLLIPYKKELIGDPRSERIHGGVISTAMDAAGGGAGFTMLSSSKDVISTIDIRIDYLWPGRAEDLIVEGKIIRASKHLIFTDMHAFHPNDDQWIASGRAVFKVKRSEIIKVS